MALTFSPTNILILATMGCVSLAVAACGPSSADSAPSATPRSAASSVPTTAASAADVASQQALTAYEGMWHEFQAAGLTSNWQDQNLGQYATGTALTNLTRGLYADHVNGLVTKGAPVLHPTVASAAPPSNPTTITIIDCGDSTHYLKYYASNGQPAPDDPGGRQYIKATVQRQPDGSWKVTDFGVQQVGTC